MTTGIVSSAGTLAGWFVMVKDNVGRFPGNKLWGERWGWSWFDAANPANTTSKDFRTDCLGCHIPAKATDWIYVLGYPGLKKQVRNLQTLGPIVDEGRKGAMAKSSKLFGRHDCGSVIALSAEGRLGRPRIW
jgi:hypothetical protein